MGSPQCCQEVPSCSLARWRAYHWPGKVESLPLAWQPSCSRYMAGNKQQTSLLRRLTCMHSWGWTGRLAGKAPLWLHHLLLQ